MSDIFREVEEDVQRERFRKFFEAYGSYLIALVVALFVALGGYEIWLTHENAERAKASSALVAAQRITNPKDAAAAFAALRSNTPSGYQTLVQLALANTKATAGQRDAALALYKDLAAKDSTTYGAVARLRAGWLMVDTTARPALADWLKPINDPANAWHQMAEEILAYADYRAGDTAAAMAKYAMLATDIQAPDALRSRARYMGGLLGEAGAKDFGTVPPPAPPPPGPAGMPPGLAAQ